MTFWAALGLFFFSFHNSADEAWRWVYQDGRVESRLVFDPVRQTLPEGIVAVWYWSREVAPTRIAREDVAKFAPQPTRERRSLTRFKVAEDAKSAPGILVAAPEKMWLEVPEPLLPRFTWPATQRELAFPSKLASRWRVRYLAASSGSFWLDLVESQRSAQLPISPAENRRIDVVDQGGAAAQGVTLIVRYSANRGGRIVARHVAEDGRLDLPMVPDTDEATLLVRGRGGAPVVVRGFPSTWPRLLVLAPGCTIEGRFLDADGEGLAGIELIAETPLPTSVAGFATRRATSDLDGFFRFENLPVARALLRTLDSRRGVWHAELELKAGTLSLGNLVLGPPSQIEVLLRSSLDGSPVAGAEVRAAGSEVAVSSDDEGVARLQGLDPQQALLIDIDAPFFIPRTGSRFDPPHPPRVELRLEPAFHLRGSFVDAAGKPLLPGRVMATLGNLAVFSDLQENGFFDIRLPLGQSGDLLLTSRRGPQAKLALEPGREGEIRDLGPLVPAPGRDVRGTIVSAEDGSPIAGARLWLPRPGTLHPLLAFENGDLIESTSREDGSFALFGVGAGQGLLRIEAAGFARRELELAVPPSSEGGEPLDLGVVELAPGARLLVRAPGAGSGVLARVDLRGQWQEQDFLESSVNDELAVFPQVPAGTALLTLFEGKKLLCEKEVAVPRRGELEVECRARAPRISGRVTLGGHAAPGGQLTFLAAPPGDAPQIIRRAATPGGLDRSRILGGGRPQVDVVVLPGGSFSTRDLLAGRSKAHFSLEGGGIGPAIEVVIPDADEAFLSLDFPSRRLFGRVVDIDGNPVEGAWVRERVEGLVARSSLDGTFSLFGASVGRKALQAEKFGEKSPAVEVDLPPEDDVEAVTLVLGAEDENARLEVHVLADGAPAGGAIVFLESEGRDQQLATADSRGVARFELAAPRPARVRWGASFEGRLGLSSWEESQEARQGSPEIDITEGGELRIRCRERCLPQILSEGSWDLSWWLGRLGARPFATEGQIILLPGLPPGSYRILSPRGELQAEVRAGESTEIDFP